MNQPLWQVLLNITFIGAVGRLAAVGFVLARDQPGLRASYLVVGVACAIAALAVWGGKRIFIGSLVLIALSSAIATASELAVGVGNSGWSIARLLFVLGASAVLVLMALRDQNRARS